MRLGSHYPVTLDDPRILPEPNSGCWLWIGRRSPKGYGVIGRTENGAKRSLAAHRIVYIAAGGSIPDGLDLDHGCRVHCCVNPQHVEPVTRRANVLRGIGLAAINARKNHCPKGHAYDEKNTRQDGRQRVCRACHNARTSAFAKAQRALGRTR